MAFEHFEHRADIGVRGRGKTESEAFEECAKAMTDVMADIDSIEPKKSHVLKLTAPDSSALLVKFLNELLFLKDTKKMLYSKIRVAITKNAGAEDKNEPFMLKATVFGEKIDAKKHGLKVDAKAATYTELKAEKEGNGWVAQCIIDV